MARVAWIERFSLRQGYFHHTEAVFLNELEKGSDCAAAITNDSPYLHFLRMSLAL
jgi:hypothetical protein